MRGETIKTGNHRKQINIAKYCPMWYIRKNFFLWIMKAFFLFLVIALSAHLQGQENLEKLRGDLTNALVDFSKVINSDDDKAFINSLKVVKTLVDDSRIPNCFECSIYILQETEKYQAGERKLIAAQFAVMISPDMPEVYYHKLIRVLEISFVDVPLVASTFKEFLISLSRFPLTSQAYGNILDFIAFVLQIVLAIFFIAMILRHRPILRRRLHGMFGGSRFYTYLFAAILVSLAAASILLGSMAAFVFIFIAVLFFGVTNIIEKIVMLILCILLVFAESAIIVFDSYKIEAVDGMMTADAMRAIYSPVFFDSIEAKKGAALEKSIIKFHHGKYQESAEILSKINTASEPAQYAAAVENLRGLIKLEEGDIESAFGLFKTAYNRTGSVEIASNIRHVLYGMKLYDKAELLDIKAGVPGGSIKFPSIFIPSFAPSAKNLPVLGREMVAGTTPYLIFGAAVFILFFIFGRKHRVMRCKTCGRPVSEMQGIYARRNLCMSCYMVAVKTEYLFPTDLNRYKNYLYLKEEKLRRKALTLSIFLPGAGQMALGMPIEGVFCAFMVIMPVVMGFRDISLFSPIIDSGLNPGLLIFFAVGAVFYVLSLLRVVFYGRLR